MLWSKQLVNESVLNKVSTTLVYENGHLIYTLRISVLRTTHQNTMLVFSNHTSKTESLYWQRFLRSSLC